MLRLVSSTVGPVELAAAGAVNTQVLEAYNAGDGTLNLTFSTSPWVTAKAGAPRNCVNTSAAHTCIPITFTIDTAGLPQGLSSTGITVSGDAATVDAPQTVVVLVRIGPVSVYAAPGGSRQVRFATSGYVNSRLTTQDGGKWLSLTPDNSGSFLFDYQYHIGFDPPAGMPAGNYSGSVITSGGANPTDSQTIPVSLQVTTQPIAVPSIVLPTAVAQQPDLDRITVTLAQGAPPLAYPTSPIVTVSNAGQGSLAIQNVATSVPWLKQDVLNFFKIDPTGLTQGDHGTITFTTNAANGPVTVPVDLQIVPKGPPLLYYRGVQDNVTYIPGDTVAPGDILVAKGEQLSFDSFAQATAVPLPTQLGGAAVLVNGTKAPLYYTSYGQIAFQIPFDTPEGTALVQVQRDDGSIGNKVSVKVASRAPRLNVAVNYPDGTINSAAHPIHPGGLVTVWAIGFGATSPAVATGVGAPSDNLAWVTPAPTVSLGAGLFAVQIPDVPALLAPTFVGLYQMNVAIPADIAPGTVDLKVTIAGVTSNALTLYIQ